MKKLKKFLIFLASLYVLGPVVVWHFQDKLIFIPRVNDTWQDLSKPHEVFVEHEGVKLQGWFLDKPITEDKPLFLFFGGNGQDVAFMPTFFNLTFDNAALAFNYRSFGLSEGEPSESSIFSDASFIVNDFLQQKGISKKDVVVIGISMGSGAASYLAATEEMKGFIFLVPFDSEASIAQSYFPLYPTWLYESLAKHPFDNVAHARQAKSPALFIVAEDDWIVQRENSQRFFDAYTGPKKEFIVKGGHFEGGTSSEARIHINEFLKELNSI